MGMIKRILVFGASNTKNSINKQLVQIAANRLSNTDNLFVDLNDYELPVYSVDLEREHGVHENALKFYELIKDSDAIIISVAEYNGLHTSAFKNLWDWLSRIPLDQPRNIWDSKPMLLLSASPSRRPMNNVLKVSKELFPHFGADIIADFYLPSFNHYVQDSEITDPQYREKFNYAVEQFQSHINN